MKNPRQESLRRHQRQHHLNNPWRLDGKLYIPHAYPEPIRKISYWDDVGFILNGKRIMVWWVHPRLKYSDKIERIAIDLADKMPEGDDLFAGAEKQYKKIGNSRKKIISYRAKPSSDARREYFDKLRRIELDLQSKGIDFSVAPSISVETLSWCRGVSLCAPIEVRNKEDIKALADLARRLIKGETTLADEFPEYQYGRDEWLGEAELRADNNCCDAFVG